MESVFISVMKFGRMRSIAPNRPMTSASFCLPFLCSRKTCLFISRNAQIFSIRPFVSSNFRTSPNLCTPQTGQLFCLDEGRLELKSSHRPFLTKSTHPRFTGGNVCFGEYRSNATPLLSSSLSSIENVRPGNNSSDRLSFNGAVVKSSRQLIHRCSSSCGHIAVSDPVTVGWYKDRLYAMGYRLPSRRNVHTSASHRRFQPSSVPVDASPQTNAGMAGGPGRTSLDFSSGDFLTLHRGADTRVLHVMWLRDHCRCPSCYNHGTSQRERTVNPFDTDQLDIKRASLDEDNQNLIIRWKDGHESCYAVDWLMDNSFTESASPKVDRILWDGRSIQQGRLPSVSFESHLHTEQGLRQTLQNLVRHGFSLIHEVPASMEGTRMAVERVAPVQHTLFGGMWTFTSDGAHSDTAYSRGFLGAHTDNTYFEMPAGIQVFQCLRHDGEGGETLLVDGFHAVGQMRKTHPQAVKCLSSHLVPHEYKEPPMTGGSSPGYHMHVLCPVIRLHPATGSVQFLRFNPYDRAPLNTIPPGQVAEFYQSYHQLCQAVADSKNHLWLKLRPGTVILIDNWRVLHGRSAFTGQRVMCGCYLPRDETMSKIRMEGLA